MLINGSSERRGASMTNHPAVAANRVAVVTGAASGIGLAAATRFATLGMKVCLADKNAKALKAAQAFVSTVAARADNVLSVVVDVSKIEDVQRLKSAAYNAFGE